MTSCKDIHEIIDNPDRENTYFDFKESSLLKERDGQNKLLEHVVSFANRYGGKFCLESRMMLHLKEKIYFLM